MFKGWIGEQRTELNLWFSLDKELYHRFHDVIIPSSNGTTQLDLLCFYSLFQLKYITLDYLPTATFLINLH